MYAIIQTGGKQYRVNEGDEVFVEKLEAEVGDTVTFQQVLAVGEGADVQFGQPVLSSAKVTGEVVKQGKGAKIVIFKYKSKKGYRRKQGHRQPYTRVKITGISR